MFSPIERDETAHNSRGETSISYPNILIHHQSVEVFLIPVFTADRPVADV
jgi:hypothetical protein